MNDHVLGYHLARMTKALEEMAAAARAMADVTEGLQQARMPTTDADNSPEGLKGESTDPWDNIKSQDFRGPAWDQAHSDEVHDASRNPADKPPMPVAMEAGGRPEWVRGVEERATPPAGVERKINTSNDIEQELPLDL